ncbi:hypothetical protein CRUP_020515 [Coryphaenoides rupestris]|nr:hypothetical protein CRUP_020515 [Coryphaenoides rupestris]
MAFLARFISLCNYLQDPCLVAKFQKLCGVKATFPATSESELSRDDANAKDVDATGNQSRDSCRNGSAAAVLLRSREAEADADLARAKPLRKNSLTGDVGKEFIVGNRVLFYLFTFGTELGNEMFFIVFFPFVFWNVDALVSRRLIIVWAWNLFIGQSTKDLVRWSRPASPPVVKVEVFYNSEYSMPVHPCHDRHSHTLLPVSCCRMDVITGFLYSLLILAVLQPMLDAIDGFYAAHPWAPPAILLSHVGMGLLAFSLDSWSTSRGDTAQALGTGVGVALGTHVNHRLVLLSDPPLSALPLVVPAAGVSVVARSLARFVLGVVVLLVARMAMKAVTIPALCRVFGMPAGDVRSARQHMRVELPYRYIVYSVVGFCCVCVVPYVFTVVNLA